MNDDRARDGARILGSLQQWAHDRLVPLNATLEITQRCNIRCRHCYNFDRGEARSACSGGSDQPELSADEILALIGALKAAGCFFLNITGGEALLHPALFQFLDRAQELGLSVGLLTNGVLLRPGMATALARYPNLMRVSVSIYGASPTIHDGITGSPGSFARTWAGVHALRARSVGVKVKIVIMRSNAHEVEAMIESADSRGIPYGLDVTTTVRHDGDRSSLSERLLPEQLASLCRGPLRAFMPRGPLKREGSACNCARGNCGVTSRGDVLPCISVPLAAGNIRQSPFDEIWRNSPVFRWIRALRSDDFAECATCSHRLHCSQDRGAAFTYSGSYTGVDPLVCARAEIAHELARDVMTPLRSRKLGSSEG